MSYKDTARTSQSKADLDRAYRKTGSVMVSRGDLADQLGAYKADKAKLRNFTSLPAAVSANWREQLRSAPPVPHDNAPDSIAHASNQVFSAALVLMVKPCLFVMRSWAIATIFSKGSCWCCAYAQHCCTGQCSVCKQGWVRWSMHVRRAWARRWSCRGRASRSRTGRPRRRPACPSSGHRASPSAHWMTAALARCVASAGLAMVFIAAAYPQRLPRLLNKEAQEG